MKRPDGVPHLQLIKKALLGRAGLLCMVCLSLETGLTPDEVRRSLAAPGLNGFVFQNSTCVSCQTAEQWCAEYRAPDAGTSVL
jgi:hypothetical protein